MLIRRLLAAASGVVVVALAAALLAATLGGIARGKQALLTFTTVGYAYGAWEGSDVLIGINLAEACLGLTFYLLLAATAVVLIWRGVAWLGRLVGGAGA